jgi:hypothetical protein
MKYCWEKALNQTNEKLEKLEYGSLEVMRVSFYSYVKKFRCYGNKYTLNMANITIYM